MPGVPAASLDRPVAAGGSAAVLDGPDVTTGYRGAPGGSATAGRFRWPLPGPPRVARGFDPPPQPWMSGHRGVDLAGAPGAQVRSAGAGTVLFAGSVAGRPVLTVRPPRDGLRTTYEPVRSRVTAGTRVDAGTPIGDLLAGHPGCAEAACLHWGLRRGAEYLDPLGAARARPGPAAAARPGSRRRSPESWRRRRLSPLSAGRAAWAAGRPAGRTRRGCCRPGRTAAGSRARSSRPPTPRRRAGRRSGPAAPGPRPGSSRRPVAAAPDAWRPPVRRAPAAARAPPPARPRRPVARTRPAPRCARVPGPRRGCAV
ncbi:peptidase M23 [Micromonospora sp. M42]|nr:peptidase M23 [Micromonospora sp. M42]